MYRRYSYDYIVLGAPSGGAAQLSILLKAPLLPCNFLTPIKRSRISEPDDIDSYLREALNLALQASHRVRETADILIHYDPIHDRRWITKNLTIRMHLRELPQTYRNIIKEMLRSDGTIIYIDVENPWIQFRFDENIYVQIGGADDLEDWEYIERSPNIGKYRDIMGINKYPWYTSILDNGEKTYKPESEWGSRNELLESVKEFVKENNYRLIVISLYSFYEAMILGTIAYLQILGKFKGIIIENYKQSSSTTPLKLRYLPIWAVFTTKKSLAYLDYVVKRICRYGSKDGKLNEAIYVTVPYGYREQEVTWPDSTGLDEWIAVLNRYVIKTRVIPREFNRYNSTRTLDVMNMIYREAYKLGGDRGIPRYKFVSKYIVELNEVIREIFHEK